MAFNASIRAYRRIIQNAISPIPTPFSYANTAACNQSEIAFVQIAGGHEVETNMALTHWLTLVCQEET